MQGDYDTEHCPDCGQPVLQQTDTPNEYYCFMCDMLFDIEALDLLEENEK
jgi:uncharacterized Zn finger protein (UPF0148 family)